MNKSNLETLKEKFVKLYDAQPHYDEMPYRDELSKAVNALLEIIAEINSEKQCICSEINARHCPIHSPVLPQVSLANDIASQNIKLSKQLSKIRAEHEAMRKTLAVCRDNMINGLGERGSQYYLNVLKLIEQTLSKGETE